MFGFGKLRCPVCRMEVKPETQQWTWKGRGFCSEGCKKSYRKGTKSGGGSCH